MITLNQEQCEAWLFNQPDDRIIEASDGRECVLCSFVRETTNLKDAQFIGWNKWAPNYFESFFDQEKILPLPAWATRFIDPDWIHENGREERHILYTQGKAYFVTAGQMKARWIELFGQPKPAQIQPEPKEGHLVAA